MSNPHAITTVKCANCGKVKQEANHWFVIWISPEHCFHMLPLEKRSFPDAWLDSDIPVCGQSCAQRQLEIWMTKTRNAGPAESRVGG